MRLNSLMPFNKYMMKIFFILFSLSLVACSSGGKKLTQTDQLRIEGLANLPKKQAIKFIDTNFKFYNLKYVGKDFVMPFGMTTCKFGENAVKFPTTVTGKLKYVSVNYGFTNLVGYVGSGYYKGSNIGKIRILTIRGLTSESYLVSCAIKLREVDNLKKVGSALYAMGIRTKQEYNLLTEK